MVERSRPVCKNCGSDEITAEGPVRFSVVENKWKLSGDTYDKSYRCDICETDVKIKWIPIDDSVSDDTPPPTGLMKCSITSTLSTKLSEPQDLKIFYIWISPGSRGHTNLAGIYLGKARGATFEEACEALAITNEKFRKYFDSDKLSYGGYKLTAGEFEGEIYNFPDIYNKQD